MKKIVKQIGIKNIYFYVNDVLENHNKLADEIHDIMDYDVVRINDENYDSLEKLLLGSDKFKTNLKCIKGLTVVDNEDSVLNVSDFYLSEIPDFASHVPQSKGINRPLTTDKSVSIELIEILNKKLNLYKFKPGHYVYTPKQIYTFVYDHSEELTDKSVYYNRILCLFYEMILRSVQTADHYSSLIEGTSIIVECRIREKRDDDSYRIETIFLDRIFYEEDYGLFESPIDGLILSMLAKIHEIFLTAKSLRSEHGGFESLENVCVTVIKNIEDREAYLETNYY